MTLSYAGKLTSVFVVSHSVGRVYCTLAEQHIAIKNSVSGNTCHLEKLQN